jgi:predicted amidohydrolase
LIISPWGEIIADAGDGDTVISANLDLAAVAKARKAIPSLMTNPAVEPTRFIT